MMLNNVCLGQSEKNINKIVSEAKELYHRIKTKATYQYLGELPANITRNINDEQKEEKTGKEIIDEMTQKLKNNELSRLEYLKEYGPLMVDQSRNKFKNAYLIIKEVEELERAEMGKDAKIKCFMENRMPWNKMVMQWMEEFPTKREECYDILMKPKKNACIGSEM